MAEIRPLRAWRYHPKFIKKIESLTSPLFDVVSEQQRDKLYQEEYNSIHLSVPLGSEPIANAAARLRNWKQKGIIIQDKLPAIYVYYQYFTLPGSQKEYCRKGFVSNIRLYDWNENVILRHENTMPFSVQDRKELVEKTELNVSPTHGLYTDPDFIIERYLDESMKSPLYEVEDYQGVRDVLSLIQDAKVIKHICQILKEKQVILADGHHRYEGSLAYLHDRKTEADYDKDAGYNFHMMYLTNTESDDLRILPTNRLIEGISDLNEADLLRKLGDDFHIKPIENAPDINEIILGKQYAFGLLIGDKAYKVRLKPEKVLENPWKFPDVIKSLDLTIMHYFIFEKALGIPGHEQRASRNIRFERNFTECLKQVITRKAQLAIITQDISIDIVKEVCYSGFTLPQKSTYFYPKVICGFLFSSINDEEFKSPFNTSFQFAS